MNTETLDRMKRAARVLNRAAILLTLLAGAVEAWEATGA